MNRIFPFESAPTTAECLSSKFALYHWQFMHIVNSELLSLIATVGNKYVLFNKNKVLTKGDRQQMALRISDIFRGFIAPSDMDIIEALATVRTRGSKVFSKYCTVSLDHLKLLFRLKDIERHEQWLDAIVYSGISVIQLKELLKTQSLPPVLTSPKKRIEALPLWVIAQQTINYSVLPNFFIGSEWSDLQQLLLFEPIENNALHIFETKNQQLIINISYDVASFKETVSRRLNTQWNFNIWEIGAAIRSKMADGSGTALLHSITLSFTQRFGSQFNESFMKDTVMFAQNYQDIKIRYRICSALQWEAIRQILYLVSVNEQLFYTKLLAKYPVPSSEIKAFISRNTHFYQDVLKTGPEYSSALAKTKIITNRSGNNIDNIKTHLVTLEDELTHSKAVPIINHNIGLLAFLQSVLR